MRRAARRCVVSLATDHRRFPEALARLRESLERHAPGVPVLAWEHGELPPGSPVHEDVPFAFKPFALAEARRRGFDTLLWMDAACVAVRSLEPVFDRIESRGHVLFRNGTRRVGEWAAPHALAALGVSREEAMEMPELNAAALGLRSGHPFLDQWLEEARRGTAFRGDKSEHRHDQSVAGVLAARLRMRPLPRGLVHLRPGRPVMRRWVRIAIARDLGRDELSSASRVERVCRLAPLVRF